MYAFLHRDRLRQPGRPAERPRRPRMRHLQHPGLRSEKRRDDRLRPGRENIPADGRQKAGRDRPSGRIVPDIPTDRFRPAAVRRIRLPFGNLRQGSGGGRDRTDLRQRGWRALFQSGDEYADRDRLRSFAGRRKKRPRYGGRIQYGRPEPRRSPFEDVPGKEPAGAGAAFQQRLFRQRNRRKERLVSDAGQCQDHVRVRRFAR